MVSFPPCKINLGLRIIRKRTDGFHEIETCFYPLPFTDILEIIPSSQFLFTSSGNVIPGSPESNLCVKAYALMRKEYDISPVRIHLHKIIPAGAGLGGGSANAAHSLRLLNEVFELNVPTEKLFSLASSLGSDCSFFIQDNPMLAGGRGEILKPSSVNLKGKFLLLLNPSVHISTADAYAGVSPTTTGATISEIVSGPVDRWEQSLSNDFERSIFFNFPIIRELKEMLYSKGALYASMSGSGSSVFGIYDREISTVDSDVNNYLVWKGFL